MERRYYFIIIALLLLPSVSADISNAQLTFRGVPVDTLGVGKTLPGAVFSFNITGVDCDSGCPLFVDLQEFSYTEENSNTNECEKNDNGFFCSVERVSVFSDDELLEYEVGVQSYIDGEYSPIIKPGSFRITLDDTAPRLAKLETGFCTEGNCYVGSLAETTVRATFEDTLSSFDYHLIMFAVGEGSGLERKHAESCSGMTCEARVQTGYCAHGETVLVQVLSDYSTVLKSSEDALNPVETGSIEAICDATKPELTHFSLSSDSGIPNLFTTNDDLVLEATIVDAPNTAASVRVESDAFETREEACAETEAGTYDCSLRISNLRNGSHNVHFDFFDAVGNVVSREERIVVLEAVEEEDIDFVTTHITDVTPNPMNRVALDLAMANGISYPVLIDYKLTGSQVRLAGQSLDRLECEWSDRPITNETNVSYELFSRDRSFISNPAAKLGEENRFLLNFRTDAGSMPATLYANCAFDVYVMSGDTFYSLPERETFSFSMNFANSVLGAPGQSFVDEIKRSEEDIEGGLGKALLKLQEIGEVADKICGGYYTLVSVNGLGKALQGVGLALMPYGEAVIGAGDAIEVPTTYGLSFLSDEYSRDQLSAQVLSKANPEGVPDENSIKLAQGIGQSGGSFSLASICSWWTCADAADADGFLGGTGLSCGEINDWILDQAVTDTSNVQGGATFFPDENVVGSAEKNTPVNNPSNDNPLDLSQGINFEMNVDPVTFTQSHLQVRYGEFMSGATPRTIPRDEISQEQTTGVYTSVTDGTYCAPQYSKSLLTSLGLTGTGFCAKGVIYNLGKWQAIDCGYVSCLKEQSSLGASVNVCKQARDFKECTAVFDEIFELPIINVFTRTSALINAKVQNAPLDMILQSADTYCATGRFQFEVVRQIVIDRALSMATSGVYDAVKEIANFISQLEIVRRFVPVLDTEAGTGRPVATEFSNFACKLKDAIWRFSEVSRIQSGGSSLGFGFVDNTNICEAALCNGPDCDRGGVTASWLDSVQDIGLLLAAEQTYERSDYAWLTDDLIESYGDALGEANDHLIAIPGIITSENSDFRQYRNFISSYLSDSSGVSVEEYVHAHGNDLPDGVTAANVQQSVNAVLGAEREYTFDEEAGTLTARVEGFTSEAIELSKDEINVLRLMSNDNQFTDEELAKAITIVEECGGPCVKGTDEERMQNIASFEEKNQELFRDFSVASPVEIQKFREGQKTLLARMNRFTANYENSGLSDEEREGLVNELSVECNLNSQPGVQCLFDPETGQFTITNDEGQQLYVTSSEIDDKKRERLDGFYEVTVTFLAKWLYDQGYLNNLKLSSFGDWGAEASARADKLWNPETWKNNLCSAEIDILVDDNPLVGLALTDGPVLTFAGEVREVTNETETKYVYTISYFVRAPDDAEDNTFYLTMNPGGVAPPWKEEPDSGAELLAGQELRDTFAFEDEQAYTELCARFDEPFSSFRFGREYCVPFVESAFNRGEASE